MADKWYYNITHEYTHYALVAGDIYSLSSVKIYEVSVKSINSALNKSARWNGSYINIDLESLMDYTLLEDEDTKDELIAAYAKRKLRGIDD